MAGNRPISPHLGVYKWGPHMAVSILHRATGDGLAIVGVMMFLWWLGAIAGGPASYDAFVTTIWRAAADQPLSITNWIGRVVLVGLSWAFFQHLFSGLRHLLLDTGAGFELKTNRFWATMTMIGAGLATTALWLYIFGRALA